MRHNFKWWNVTWEITNDRSNLEHCQTQEWKRALVIQVENTQVLFYVTLSLSPVHLNVDATLPNWNSIQFYGLHLKLTVYTFFPWLSFQLIFH